MNFIAFFMIIASFSLIASAIFGCRYANWAYPEYHEADRMIGWFLFTTSALLYAVSIGMYLK